MITNLTATGDVTKDNATVSTRDGNPGAVKFAISGTFTATVLFEGCSDTSLAVASQVWTAIGAKKLIDETIVASVTAAAIVEVPAGGFMAVRARCSAYTSGTIIVDSAHVKRAAVTF